MLERRRQAGALGRPRPGRDRRRRPHRGRLHRPLHLDRRRRPRPPLRSRALDRPRRLGGRGPRHPDGGQPARPRSQADPQRRRCRRPCACWSATTPRSNSSEWERRGEAAGHRRRRDARPRRDARRRQRRPRRRRLRPRRARRHRRRGARARSSTLERPDVVINCAAWTDVDGAEEAERGGLRRQRHRRRQRRRRRGRGRSASVVYVSTDYVFDGSKGAPYVESDQPAPLSAYGRTKLAGEEATAAANKRHFVVRSAWPLRDRRPQLRRDDAAPRRRPRTRSSSSATRSARRPTPGTSPTASSA